MPDKLRICLAQMTSTNRHEGNIAWMRDAATHAADAGCGLLALPEAAGMMNRDAEDARRQITTADADPFLEACREAAARHGLWIHAGSTPVAAGDGRFLNHGELIDDSGATVAGYDKIHLFDVFLKDRAPTGESARYAPGDRAVMAETPWGPVALTICYDLRFPHLYRDQAKAGATVLFVPAAFTVPTGQAHWEVLLRARAIENGAFVVAAAQVGHHADGRETWGHSMIVDPWGRVLADMGRHGPGLEVVDLDIGQVADARAQIPSLANERPYRLERVARRASHVV